jgi:hypothetical protein
MRHYSLMLPQFWTGTTGKAITAASKDARIVATYLLTCEHANMIGLYRLPLLYAAEETGLKRREVAVALEHLKLLEFAYYDEATEFVWVVEMARFQLSLSPGEAINDKDTRVKTVAALYKHLPTNPFLAPFFDRYVAILRLPCKRDFLSEQKPHRSPMEGASVPHTRDTYSVSDPDPDSVRKGEVGETITSLDRSTLLTPEQIRDRWNAIEGVKTCGEIGKTIRDRIGARLREHSKVEWWDTVFHRVRASDFLCGRTNGARGSFRASLTWTLSPTNLDKLLAGDYDSIASNGHQPPTCTKRIQRPTDRFIRPCAQPADPTSKSNEPRCSEHLTVEANGHALH